MSDAMPNYAYEIARLKHQRLQILTNVADCEAQLIEITGRRERLQTNIEASHRAIAEMEEKIASLESVHGAQEVSTDG